MSDWRFLRITEYWMDQFSVD